MRFDIVLVLYNSVKWLPRCIAALDGVGQAKAKLNLLLVDNASTDGSAELAGQLQQEYTGFGGFTLYQNPQNHGFGAACNVGAAKGSAPYLFFLNVDTEVELDIFTELEAGIAAHPEAGGFECRQLPYEMGHHINPVTLETPWASGAAMVLRRDIFSEVGGFDKHIFMYCEDVDLSWRVRATGHPLIYLPRAVVNHFVLNRANTGESERQEYTSTQLGRLLLAYKYGSFRQMLAANKLYLHTLKYPRHFSAVRRVLAQNYLKHFGKLWPFWFWRMGNRRLFKAAPAVLNQPEFAPDRGREVQKKRIQDGPLISVVVRTHSRPETLRQTLQSLANQTYRNFEIVVVEDGKPTSEQMIETEFSALTLRYFYSGIPIGRARNGNFGLAAAKGEYLNFLDDDDFFYPEHLELMAQKALQNPEAELIVGRAMANKVVVTSQKPYSFESKELFPFQFDHVNLFTMAQTCQIPIQSAMFKRSLYERYGGLYEKVNGNEDWGMWLQFLKTAKRIDTQHVDIHRATSMFLLPADGREEERRALLYQPDKEVLYKDESFTYQLTLAEMRSYYSQMIADMQHLNHLGILPSFLEKEAKRNESPPL